jgi:hypothetical protein
MRTVTTVILRLLRNDSRVALRGTLQTLDDPAPCAFKDERELLALLRQIATASQGDLEGAPGRETHFSKGEEP